MNSYEIIDIFNDYFNFLRTPGLVKKFIADLHSGKLHREFHHGPDPTTSPPGVSQ